MSPRKRRKGIKYISPKIFILAFILSLAACANVFDSENAAVTDLAQYAFIHREFDKPNANIHYLFVNDPDLECTKRGTLVRGKIAGCADYAADPCLIVLSYTPTKLQVLEEQLHCRYGNFHK